MAESTPVGAVKTVAFTFEYNLTQECIDDAIDQTGLRPPRRWRISIDLSQDVDSPQIRKRIREAHAIYTRADDVPELPRPVGEDVDAFLSLIEPWVEERKAPVEAEENQGEDFERQMKAWVEQHGSQRLQMGLARGYKVNRRYALERAAVEVPGAWIDTADTADLRERADPSIEALELERQVNERVNRLNLDIEGVIMWVVEGPRGTQGFLVDEEAIVLRRYLGRYTAILPVNSDYWRSADDEDES